MNFGSTIFPQLYGFFFLLLHNYINEWHSFRERENRAVFVKDYLKFMFFDTFTKYFLSKKRKFRKKYGSCTGNIFFSLTVYDCNKNLHLVLITIKVGKKKKKDCTYRFCTFKELFTPMNFYVSFDLITIFSP